MEGEAEVLQRVFDRLLATPDDKLQEVLSKLLPRLVSMLERDHNRQPLLAIFGHILKRVKPDVTVQLPCIELLGLLEPTASPFVRNFCVAFLDLGILRVPAETKAVVAQSCLTHLRAFNVFTPVSDSLLNYVLALLPSLRNNQETLLQDSPITDVVTDFLVDVLMVQSGIQRDGVGSIQPGLSPCRASRLTCKIQKWDGMELTTKKQQILDLITSRALPIRSCLLLCLIATADNTQSIAQRAAGIVAAMASSASARAQPLDVTVLFRMFLGDSTSSGDAQSITFDIQRLPASELLAYKRSEVRDAVRIGIINYVMKENPESVANSSNLTLRVVLTSFLGERSSTKLRASSAGLGKVLVSRCSNEVLPVIGPLILQTVRRTLQQFVASSGRKEEDDDTLSLKEQCYETVAAIAQRSPTFVAQDYDLIITLFKLVEVEDERIKIRVSSALGEMRKAVEQATHVDETGETAKKHELLGIIFESSRSSEYRARLAALGWVIALHGIQSPESVRLLVTLSADSHQIVRQAVENWVDRLLLESRLNFESMASVILQPEFIHSIASHSNVIAMTTSMQLLGNSFRAYALARGSDCVYEDLILPWTPPVLTNNIEVIGAFAGYARAIVLCLQPQQQLLPGGDVLLGLALGNLLELLSCVSNINLFQVSDCRSICFHMLSHKDGAVRLAAAKVLGLLTLQMDTNDFATVMRLILLKAVPDNQNESRLIADAQCCSSLWAGAYSLSLKSRTFDLLDSGTMVDEFRRHCHDFFSRLTQLLGDDFAEIFSIASMNCAGELSSCCRVSLIEDSMVGRYLDLVTEKLGSTNVEMKASAIQCLSHYAAARVDAGAAESVIDYIYQYTCTSDSALLKFAAGQALTRLCLQPSLGLVRSVLSKLLDCPTGVTSDAEFFESRTSRATWLVVLICQSSILDVIADRVSDISDFYLELLGSESVYAQDMATRGLGLMYEKLSVENRNSILTHVVNTLTRERNPRQPLGYTHGPASELSTTSSTVVQPTGYQRRPGFDEGGVFHAVCKLAKETGQSEIVFQLMMLIYHNPTWSVGNMLHSCEKAYKPSVKKELKIDRIEQVVPQLFRYKHDPTPATRQVMERLWAQIVPFHNLAITTHFHAIMQDLLLALESRRWRERESACNGLVDILPGRNHADVQQYLERLLYLGLRVLDDMRDSVRTAAIEFMKVLVSLIVRLCDSKVSEPEAVASTCTIVIPFLLHKGLLDYSVEGKGVSIGCLIRIVKAADKHLKPHLTSIIDTLIEAMSALEPRSLQYMQFHTASYDMTEDQLEALRVKLAQDSPLQEALDSSLLLVDAIIIPDVVSICASHLRTGVGLATRSAAATAIIFLCEHFPDAMRLYSERVFQVLLVQLTVTTARSETLMRQTLSAIGTISKLVEGDGLRSSVVRLCERYVGMTSENSQLADTLSSTVSNILTRSGEAISSGDTAWQEIITASFVGSFDGNEKVKKQWTSVINEACVASGLGTRDLAVKACYDKIVTTCLNLFKERSWTRRRQGMQGLTSVLTMDGLSHSQERTRALIVEAIYVLLRSLPGRIWEGQSEVLVALSAATSSIPGALTTQRFGKLMFSSNVVALELKDIAVKLFRSESARDSAPMLSGTSDALKGTIEDDKSVNVSVPLSDPAKLVADTEQEELPSAENSLALTLWSAVTISLPSLVAVFLNECIRGDRDYKRTSVQALSRLPLKAIASDKSCLDVWKLLKFMFEACGVSDLSLHMDRDDPSENASASDIMIQPSPSTDPVFRSRMIECAANIYPGYSCEPNESCSFDSQIRMMVNQLLQWALEALGSEVWSVKASVLKFVGSVAARSAVAEDTELVELILTAITLGMDDARFAQVRAAAVSALADLWTNPSGITALCGSMRETEQHLWVTSQTDSDPRVLQAMTQLSKNRQKHLR